MRITNFQAERCEKTLSQLDSYLSNELPDEACQQVSRHVEECEKCASTLDDRARVRAHLKRILQSERVPDRLRERIQNEIRRSSRSKHPLSTSWIIAAAAFVVLGLLVGVFLRSNVSPSARPISLTSEVAADDQAGRILKVAFDGHVSCAVDHGMADKHFTFEQMSEELGVQYEGLVTLVKNNVPQDLDVVVGHRCHYQGREFLHLILRKQERIVSLIVTRKRGDDFPAGGAATVVTGTGVQIYESAWHNVQVAGMETRDHLTFVVSNESQKGNEEIASSLMPSVWDFLTAKEA